MVKAKQILSGKKALDKLASGADQLAEAVVSTLGPRSANVAIESPLPYLPRVVHDGVTVARNIILEDPVENMGSLLLLDAASKTNDNAGDGTTTAILLANTIVQLGKDLVQGGVDKEGVVRQKVNPMQLREELLVHSEKICAELDKLKKDITEKKDYQQIATISAQNAKIGSLVADVIEKVGKDGIIIPEEVSGYEDTFEHEQGMQFDNGFLAAEFVTNANRMITEYEDGYVLLTDYTITHPDQITSIIEQVRNDSNKPLLIIANDVVGAALHTMVVTKLKAGYKLCAVMAPEFAERRKEMLEDLAILTGAEVIAQSTHKIEEVKINQLGKFKQLLVSFTNTTIVPKFPDNDDVKERVEAIKEQIANESNEFRKERLQYRLAKLGQGVITIKVAGASDAERDEKKERYIDSIKAVKAALAEGIVSGGGTTLVKVALNLDLDTKDPVEDLVLQVLTTPMKTIQQNAGLSDEVDFKSVHDGFVYDVVSKKKVNALEAGIIDPVKVTKEAVRNAFSVAAMILTTKVTVTNKKEDKNESNI